MALEIHKTLSTTPHFSFGNSIESFFEKYFISESAEYYRFFCDPSRSTSVQDLKEISYSKDIVIWAALDSLLTFKRYNYYTDAKIDFIHELEKFCKKNKNKKFILFSCGQYELQKFVSVSNLFIIDLINNYVPGQQYTQCDNKILDSKPWICLSSRPEPHKFAVVSYLIGKQLDKTGKLCIDNRFSVSKRNFELAKSLFKFDRAHQKIFFKGFKNFLDKKFTKHPLSSYSGNNIHNYHTHLFPAYKTTALEIVIGSLFIEPAPFFNEKEIQCIYGKNLPIFINGPGSIKVFRDQYGLDMFEDIIDHSYDSVEDPSLRIFKAIDDNEHLLRDSELLTSLWYKNEFRLDENCKKMNKILYDKNYQIKLDEKNIKKAFDYFKISYTSKI